MSVCAQNQPSLKSASPSLLNNQGGQAILEYLLILIVVVGIILGGLYQLNTAFKAWAENYFGSYLSCLLETGELPALGGAFMSDAGICNELYEPFSIDNGRPLIASSGSTSSGTGSSSGSSSSSSSSKRSDSDSGSKPSGERGTRETSGGSSGSSQINPSSKFTSSRSGSSMQSNPASRRGSSDTYTGSTEGSIPTSLLGSGSNARQRIKMSEMGYDYFSDRDQVRKPIKSSEGGIKADEQHLERTRKKATPFRAPAAKAKTDEESGMSFGSFLRYLVIAAIIIALLLVVGGQLLQISKSSD